MVEITIAFGILVVLLGIIVGCVSYLRSRPGFRRRGPDPEYNGPPRRYSDNGSEINNAVREVFSPEKRKDFDEEHDMMNSFKHNEGNK